MPASIPTPLDVAASIDRVLRRDIQWPVANITFADSPFLATPLNRSIMALATGGPISVSLPDATLVKGMFFEVKKTDASANPVAVMSSIGGQTIDGAGSKVLTAFNDFLTVESDGSNYKIQSSSTAAPPPGATPEAATFVVHPTPGVGDFTTIQAALAALPATGGYILVREGTYTPPVGGYIFPDSAVEIIGCGSGFDGAPSTLIDATAFGPGKIFSSAFKKHRRIADLNIRGNGLAGQIAYQNDTGTQEFADFENVRIVNVQTFLGNTAPFNTRLFQVFYNPSLAVDAQFWTFLGGVGGNSFIDADEVQSLGATIDGNPFLRAVNSTFHLTLFSGPFVNHVNLILATISEFAGEILLQSGGSKFGECNFVTGIFGVAPARYLDSAAGSLVVTGSTFGSAGTEHIRITGTCHPKLTGSVFVGANGQTRCLNVTASQGIGIGNCTFHGCSSEQVLINGGTLDTEIVGCDFVPDGPAPRAIDILAGAFRGSITGNAFAFFSTEAIRIAGDRWMVSDNTGCRVVETGAANNNRYSNNDGFDPSAIIGGASLIENENVLPPVGVNITLDEFMRTVPVDASGAARTITLPTAASAKWRKYIIKKVDGTANTVTIAAAGVETIDGAATVTLTVQYQSVEIQSDGTTWWIV